MGKKKKKKKRHMQCKKELSSPLEYYTLTFSLLLNSLIEGGYEFETPHPIRKSFWQVFPQGEYPSNWAIPNVVQYQRQVEKALSLIISEHSIAYWLHIYRRLFPGPIGRNKEPATIMLVRGTLDAAIQKYGLTAQCGGVGFSDEVPIESVLNGMLMENDSVYQSIVKNQREPVLTRFVLEQFKALHQSIRTGLKNHRQLVLTKFGLEQFKAFYDVEKLAYEIWKSTAVLRSLGKGGSLIVTDEPVVSMENPYEKKEAEYFYDSRSDELDKLIKIYDKRISFGSNPVTATATVFTSKSEKAYYVIPFYNTQKEPASVHEKFFKSLGLTVPITSNSTEECFNFSLSGYDLEGYFKAHEPFAESFRKKYGLPMNWVQAVLGSLLYRFLSLLHDTEDLELIRCFQRAYDGPRPKTFVYDDIRNGLPFAVKKMDLKIDVKDIDLGSVIHFLELNDKKRKIINPSLIGPHSVLLPLKEDMFFIDYAWIHRILYNLFHDVKLDDQNFKGDALEKLVRRGQSVLPAGPCKALNGESRQIDASFKLDDILIIVECKAVSRSLGFDRGDLNAIEYRKKNAVERSIKEIDEKGNWLTVNPVGSNYDIREFKKILPVAVTPFVEYIHSLNPYYWLSECLPRVITPYELEIALKNNSLKEAAMKSPNTLFIKPL